MISYQDLLYLISSLAIAIVSVFLCWALYQLAILLRQANDMVTDTREKVERVEDMVVNLVEKVSTVSKYLGFLTEGGKKVMGMMGRGSDEDEEEEEEEVILRKTKRKK